MTNSVHQETERPTSSSLIREGIRGINETISYIKQDLSHIEWPMHLRKRADEAIQLLSGHTKVLSSYTPLQIEPEIHVQRHSEGDPLSTAIRIYLRPAISKLRQAYHVLQQPPENEMRSGMAWGRKYYTLQQRIEELENLDATYS